MVAFYEEGRLEWLEEQQLTAYLGIPADQERGIVRWGNDGGAILLPVSTARDLVDAVADHTPWPLSAADVLEMAS